MALSIDSSTVAAVTQDQNVGNTVTTASFTPSNNSLLLVAFACNEPDTADQDVTVSDSQGGTWTKQAEAHYSTTGIAGNNASFWTTPITTGVSMTVTGGHGSGLGRQEAKAMRVYIVTGHDTSDPVGSTVVAGNISTTPINPGYTSTRDGSWGFLALTEGVEASAVSSSDTIDTNYNPASASCQCVFIKKAAATVTSGSSVTLNASATTPSWNYAVIELMPVEEYLGKSQIRSTLANPIYRR